MNHINKLSVIEVKNRNGLLEEVCFMCGSKENLDTAYINENRIGLKGDQKNMIIICKKCIHIREIVKELYDQNIVSEDIKDKKCPVCTQKLVKRYKGLVCKNWKCPLYHKIDYGWIYTSPESTASKKDNFLNNFYNSNIRLLSSREWALLKQKILIKYNYTCQKCTYTSNDEYKQKKRLDVHHIIPASEEMALYLDEDNLILLCEDCHKKVHSQDKKHF